MGKSPDRRHRQDSDAEDDYRRSSHKESHRYRNKSDEDRSDDEYERQKKERKERKKHEKEMKKREMEGRERGSEDYDREGRKGGYERRGGERSGHGQGEYVSSQAPPQQQYRPYGAPPSGHHQPYSGGDHQRAPEQGYGQQSQYTAYSSPSPYSQPPHSPEHGYNHAPVPPPTTHGFQGHYQPPPQGGYQNQYPPPSGPPPSQGAYQGHPPSPPQGVYRGQYLPPPGGVYQGQYPPPPGPPPSQPVYQGQYPPPAPASMGSMGSPGAPAGGNSGTAAGLAAGLDFNSRPQYATGGTATGGYKPQAHSTAQEAGDGMGSAFFSGKLSTPSTTCQGGSVLDSFTKGLNQALHGYARTLFPATSVTGSGQAGELPEARTGERFESFAPVRNGNAAKWYIDGKDYMFAVSVALERARESIWILDCMLHSTVAIGSGY